MLKSFLCAIALVATAACSSKTEEIDKEVAPRVRSDICLRDNPCAVSIHSLVSDPEKWDEKYVVTEGFYSVGRDPALFVSKESSDYAILRNGLSVELIDPASLSRAPRVTDRWVMVVGRFRSNAYNESNKGALVFQDFSGRINQARVVPFRSKPWSCGYASANIQDAYEGGSSSCHRDQDSLKAE